MMGVFEEDAEQWDDVDSPRRRGKVRIRTKVKTKVRTEEAVRREWAARIVTLAKIAAWLAGTVIFAVAIYYVLDGVNRSTVNPPLRR
jgi:hypothetical protein